MGKSGKTKLEIDFEKDCVKKLRSLPKSCWFHKLEDSSIRGIPDRIGSINGTMVLLEFKRDKEGVGEPRAKLQGYVLDMFEESGAYVAFVYPENWLLVYDELKSLAYRKYK